MRPRQRATYDYVKRAYGVDPRIGARVRHQETGGFGTIAPASHSQNHYVMVMFDGRRHASPCHPTALDYNPLEAPAHGQHGEDPRS